MPDSNTLAHARALVAAGDLPGAVDLLDSHLQTTANDISARHLSALILARLGDAGGALERLRDCLQLAPASPQILSDMGKLLAGAGRLSEAVGYFEQASRLDAGNSQQWMLLGTTLRRLGRGTECVAALGRAHELAPTDIAIRTELAEALFESASPAAALPHWQALSDAAPDDVHASLRLGETLGRLGLHEASADRYRRALARAPRSAALHLAHGQALEDLGKRTAAAAAYRNALEAGSSPAKPMSALIGLEGRNAATSLLAEAGRLRDGLAAMDPDRALLGYELGKAHDAQGRHAEAFENWRDANAVRRRLAGPFDQAALRRWVEDRITRPRMGPLPPVHHDDHADESLVFIVGMPRSGTTLTERIASAHPDVSGCGELPDLPLVARRIEEAGPAALTHGFLAEQAALYLASARRNSPSTALRLTDKAPLNFFHLDMIAQLFPRARIVWCRRDPRDIAISIFSQNFSPEATFATDLSDIAFYIAMHERLMSHWMKSLSLPVLEFDHEQLTRTPEEQSRRLIDFLGLEWDPSCLRFHEHAAGVQTPSRWQVREPVNSRSVGRWRNHAARLDGLFTSAELTASN